MSVLIIYARRIGTPARGTGAEGQVFVASWQPIESSGRKHEDQGTHAKFKEMVSSGQQVCGRHDCPHHLVSGGRIGILAIQWGTEHCCDERVDDPFGLGANPLNKPPKITSAASRVEDKRPVTAFTTRPPGFTTPTFHGLDFAILCSLVRPVGLVFLSIEQAA